ncbi:MAG TPA: DUF2891 domain-containing protein [Sphingomicrobium sp.]|nr:DUF2891 domain-containing protein [Sphingomicrobium sp.]
MRLDAGMASRMAGIALGHVTREYPHKLDQVLLSDQDLAPPRVLHPVFFGSFDWHSGAHGWWSRLTLRRLFPDIAEAPAIEALADSSFTVGKVGAELAYLDRPLSAGFERPYGWAWLLHLHLEASRHEGRPWATDLELLARAFAGRFKAYLPKLTYPIRVGTHFNTAFALVLAQEWAEEFDRDLTGLIAARARTWFQGDRGCQACEPGGDDFLSSALTEALLMRRVLDEAEFRSWFAAFLPRLEEGEPATLFTPAIVSDRSDGKIAHLDGLNLSRAWCWRALGYPEPAETHLEAALPHLSGDYMGEHWLQSFALLALMTGETR